MVPAAPDAWILALERYGTMSFGEVAAAAIRYAREGFAVHPVMATFLARYEVENYRRWPENTAIFRSRRRACPPRASCLVQTDSAASIQYMADEEKAAADKGRAAGLAAARDAFYRGDIARDHRDVSPRERRLAHGRGSRRVPLARSSRRSASRFSDIDVLTCGPWCQGPVLLQMLSLLDERRPGARSATTRRPTSTCVAEAMKLCFADRERYYGDPRFVDVADGDAAVAAPTPHERRRLIGTDRAFGRRCRRPAR